MFFVGEEKRFELSGDNYYDLLIRLNSITSSKAEFTIQKIYEKVADQTEENAAGGENEEEETTKEKMKWWKILLIIISIVILLIVIFLILIRYILPLKNKKRKLKRIKNKIFLTTI